MDCKTCQSELPGLLIESEGKGAVAVRAHIASCEACTEQLAELEMTFALLDTWTVPEVSPYFDQKLMVRLREEQEAPPAGWFERLRDRLRFGTGNQFRPAMAAAFALALIAAGGGIGVTTLSHSHVHHLSATVNDLQILDNNEQALQQEDQVLQESTARQPEIVEPQS
jgi:anti-sigma factor RsiW